MIPKPAQYLLRFDDLCPTLPAEHWKPFRNLIKHYKLRPILAIVPENRDAELDQAPADPNFWDNMHRLEDAGATVALHGYRHLCQSAGKNLVGIHPWSEFAGVKYETQRQWMDAGLQILRGKGLHPKLWIAPRHGFDRNTIRSLRELGLGYISDGFARMPFRQYGITWIPQQLWGPAPKKKGLWTICIHPHTATRNDAKRLECFLEDCGNQFTSFDRVTSEFESKRLGIAERVYQRITLERVRRRSRRRLKQEPK
jgi:predicted deacetylase